VRTRVNRLVERCAIINRALQALAHDMPLTINGQPRGKLRMIANDHLPRREWDEGGSTMRLVFTDDSSIPGEDVRSIERTAA
jgi:hypothetical protein